MARLNPSPIRMYRGTTAQHAGYTGPQGELTVDTDKKMVVVQDGTTAGGIPAARDDQVVHLTGNETINGKKTFNIGFVSANGDITIYGETLTNDTPGVDLVPKQSLTRGGAAPANIYAGSINLFDSNNSLYARVRMYVDGAGETGAFLCAYKNQTADKAATIAVRNPQSGDPYATAPNTRSTPADNEIVTYDFLQNYVIENTDDNFYLPLYFQVGVTESIHTFLPAGVTSVRRANIEADGAGIGSLTITMARDVGSTTSMTVGTSATNCSAYAGHGVEFTISGTSNQTEVSALLIFE